MDYHGRIMNIEVDVASMAAAGKPRSLRFAFKAGHRDARHAAAEIANEAQREIDDTAKKLAVAKEIITALREVCATHDAEIARLREALRLLLNACDYSTTARMYVAAESSVIAARAALSQESGR
jgi:uncharacterized coiled-coil protein SlyX